MPWSTNDNRNIRGPLDSEWVALTEPWEVDAFVRQYLNTRGHADTAEHRRIVRDDATAYPGRRPVKRTTLEAHLDDLYARRARERR